LSSAASVPELDASIRTVVCDALRRWAEQEFGDLDRPEPEAERYVLEGVRLP
jgi:hypothetical protein